MKCKFLLVGGGLASAKAAERLRTRDADASIILVSAEPHLPYDRPPLSKAYLRGEVERERIFIHPEEFYRENNITTILNTTAQHLNLKDKSVTLSNGEKIYFDKLLIATGGRPRTLDVSGAKLQGIHYLRNIADSEAIGKEAGSGGRAVIVGAGFIGMEVAASLTRKGVKVTLIEAAPHIWARFLDASMASFFQRYCEEKGVTFHTNAALREFRGKDKIASIVTMSGLEFPCDFAIVGVGIIPNVELAQVGGLKINNGIVVDEYMRTSYPDIYGAGDVTNYYDPIMGRHRRVEHWGHAEYSGGLAGENMTVGNMSYDLLTYAWSDIFDLHLEFAGDETECEQVLIRGALGDESFIVLYLKHHRLTAYFAVNCSEKEYQPLQSLIRKKTDLSGMMDRLRNRSFNLETLT